MSDDELDRLVATMTDASPSPRLRANVMQRVAANPASLRLRSGQAAGFTPARLAVAAVVVLVAVSAWFALRPAPAPRLASREPARPGNTVTVATPRAAQAPVATSAAPPTQAARLTPRRAREIRTPDADLAGEPTQNAELEPVEQLPPIPPVEITPLEQSGPITIPLVKVTPIAIPQIEIQPMEDRPDKNSPPQQGGPRRIP